MKHAMSPFKDTHPAPRLRMRRNKVIPNRRRHRLILVKGTVGELHVHHAGRIVIARSSNIGQLDRNEFSAGASSRSFQIPRKIRDDLAMWLVCTSNLTCSSNSK